MKITIEVPDEYAKPFLDEIKMTLKMINNDSKLKVQAEPTKEDLEKMGIKANCPGSPDGIHAIFSPENMTGCCIYCGKAIG